MRNKITAVLVGIGTSLVGLVLWLINSSNKQAKKEGQQKAHTDIQKAVLENVKKKVKQDQDHQKETEEVVEDEKDRARSGDRSHFDRQWLHDDQY